VVSADAVEHGKPDPSIYLLAARLLGVAPAECLAFEDSLTGVRAAHAAGMRVVAVSPAESFREAEVQPHLVLRALHEFDEQHARALWASAATTGAD
jgi:beta-phosphoglucomutase-like phosphatase (HAD superfamily)